MTRSADNAIVVEDGAHVDDPFGTSEDLEDAIAVNHNEGKPLPPATSGRDFANKMQNVA